jgi:hypothetical protein
MCKSGGQLSRGSFISTEIENGMTLNPSHGALISCRWELARRYAGQEEPRPMSPGTVSFHFASISL